MAETNILDDIDGIIEDVLKESHEEKKTQDIVEKIRKEPGADHIKVFYRKDGDIRWAVLVPWELHDKKNEWKWTTNDGMILSDIKACIRSIGEDPDRYVLDGNRLRLYSRGYVVAEREKNAILSKLRGNDPVSTTRP